MNICLEIPRVPVGANELLRMHWRHRHQAQKTWDQEVWYALLTSGHLRNVIAKAHVRIDRRSRGRGLDPDNLVASVKPVLDALRHASLLEDDSPDHITLEVTQSRGAPRTLIEIQPL